MMPCNGEEGKLGRGIIVRHTINLVVIERYNILLGMI